MVNLLRIFNLKVCDLRHSNLFLLSDKTNSPTLISVSELRVEVSLHKFMLSELPLLSRLLPTMPSTLMNHQRMTILEYDRSLLVSDPRRCEPKKYGGRSARAR